MNYEELYGQVLPIEKKMKDALVSLQKLSRTISRDTENGDLKSLSRDLTQFTKILADQSEAAAGIQDMIAGFDGYAYYRDGDFAAQMLALCEEKGIDVKGESPVYEMFPYRVRIDMENQEIYLNRKKIQCMRPSSFVQTVKKGQERLARAVFKPEAFADELSNAYNTAALKENKPAGTDIYLTTLYGCLVPMGRSKREYDMQSYAFDLARLYISGIEVTKSGRRFQFGPSRYGRRSIRILDGAGKEQFLATIRFYEEA